ncbi:MAG: GNAT family N-acetyltransferase [Flexibacter sp. CG_4_10_14_3_um_filter_32_15]|nr:MAG: GNAT family N-acetyltransferase [Flexibacter sp. CG_4_10_14_3_um_filter_32_15]
MHNIRFYQNGDKKALIKLIQLNIPTYFDSSEEDEFVEYLENKREDYFVIEDKNTNQIIGCGGINYFFDDKDISRDANNGKNLARISWDIIHPSFQGQGIGKKLLLHRINQIKSKEIQLIIVRTSQLAYKFYQKVGFELEKTEKDFWAKGFDLYQMKMNL